MKSDSRNFAKIPFDTFLDDKARNSRDLSPIQFDTIINIVYGKVGSDVHDDFCDCVDEVKSTFDCRNECQSLLNCDCRETLERYCSRF